ncbi:MAG TPA: Gfo/Idh/MocA family oxidoreductase, partial [Anaerolineae bacterium]|nr:Gfo/Idh/MocA family oxidoreductase [Anaerolineae bacterium]
MTLRIGLIGCGAIAVLGHLPALALEPRLTLTVLVDTNLARAKSLGRQYDISLQVADYHQALGAMDAAIVALPHFLHAPVTIELLKAGIHVLVEKPMGLNIAECEAMLKAARSSGATLAVGLSRRHFPSVRFFKDILSSGTFGQLHSFEICEGTVFNSPVASNALFRRETAGGGVLIDGGVHTLDTLLYWLGELQVTSYQDDAFGGVEANCLIGLAGKDGITGQMELSRTRQLRNSYRFHFSSGMVELEVKPIADMNYYPCGSKLVWQARAGETDVHELSLIEIMRRQLADFVTAIETGGEPAVTGEIGRQSVALVEACYAS